MEDSACDIAPGSRETESIWVWMKPSAFYNTIEARYQQNRYLLRRCLSYSYKNAKKDDGRGEGQLEVEFTDLMRNFASMQTTKDVKKKPPAMRLSVLVVVCDSNTEREFYPLESKCVHLRAHDSVSVSFDVEQHPVKLLLIVRGNHHDMSLLHNVRSLSLSKEMSKQRCFGCLPVGEFVWWTAHMLQSSSSRVRLSQWKNGCVTLSEKTTWDGQLQRQTKMLSIERCTSTIDGELAAPHLFSFRAVSKRPASTKEQEAVQTKETSLVSTEGEVAFRFVYGVAQPQCVQQRTQSFGCPFCSIKCQDLHGLRYHLAASHDIFLYEIETGSLTVIWVRRRMEVYDDRGEIFCPITKQLISASEKAFYMNKAAYLRAKPVQKRRKRGLPSLSCLIEDTDVASASKRKTIASPKTSTSKAMK